MRRNSQVATILTLVIAAIFLFIVITINIGRVSQKKTLVDNACDSAGLFLASSLGSIANSLRFELGFYDTARRGDLNARSCDVNFVLIGGLVAIVAGAAAALFTGGGSLAVAVGVVGALTGVGMVASQTVFASYNDPAQVRQMQAKFQNMTIEQRIFETTIQNAFFAVVDDPKFVPDRFDVDRDGLKSPAQLDKITRVNHWYFQRLNSLPRIGQLIDEFYNYLFATTRSSNPLFEVIENPQSWKADSAYLLMYGERGALRVADWLNNELKPFLQEMRSYGYGVSFYNPSGAPYLENLTDLDKLILEIRGGEVSSFASGTPMSIKIPGLEEEAKSLYGVSKDELMGTFETSFAKFYNGNRTGGNWYSALNQWRTLINSWINELTVRRGEVIDCVRGCDAWVGCCEENPTYPCADDPTRTCGGGCKRDCCQEHKPCGEACGNPTCGPSSQCDTPTGGRRSCCDSGVKLKNDCDSTRIDSYIDRLRELNGALANFQNVIESIYTRSQSIRNDPWTYRAIYAWRDITGREIGQYAASRGTPESSVHMVYVRLTMPPSFKFPSIDQYQEWTTLSICKTVINASGTFDIEIGRYDEDLAKQGPLRDFWRFRFRRHPENAEQNLSLLRAVADRFASRLNDGEAATLDQLATRDEFEELARFCFDNGIVSMIRVHYGPGVTPTREQINNRSQPAAEKNRDIYIESRAR